MAVVKKPLGDKLVVKNSEGKNVTFNKKGCSTSRDAADKAANAIRLTGKNARVVEDTATGKFCYFEGGKTKTPKRK
jgi:hypothetical protein